MSKRSREKGEEDKDMFKRSREKREEGEEDEGTNDQTRMIPYPLGHSSNVSKYSSIVGNASGFTGVPSGFLNRPRYVGDNVSKGAPMEVSKGAPMEYYDALPYEELSELTDYSLGSGSNSVRSTDSDASDYSDASRLSRDTGLSEKSIQSLQFIISKDDQPSFFELLIEVYNRNAKHVGPATVSAGITLAKATVTAATVTASFASRVGLGIMTLTSSLLNYSLKQIDGYSGLPNPEDAAKAVADVDIKLLSELVELNKSNLVIDAQINQKLLDRMSKAASSHMLAIANNRSREMLESKIRIVEQQEELMRTLDNPLDVIKMVTETQDTVGEGGTALKEEYELIETLLKQKMAQKRNGGKTKRTKRTKRRKTKRRKTKRRRTRRKI